MSHLRVDEVRALLPDLAELRPLLERILATSTPDPERRWSAAGELETVGMRLVQTGSVREAVPRLGELVREEITGLYGRVARALEALERGEREEAGRLFLEAAREEERRWRMDSAAAWCQAAHRAVEGLVDRRPAALALARWARASRGAGRLAEAAARYEEAHKTALDAGDAREGALAAIGRGNVAVDRGRWSEAGRWYGRALELVEDEEASAPERWHACQNLSIVARRSGMLDESRKWLERAEATARAMGDPAAAVEVENGWGMWALAAGDPEQAEQRFRGALARDADPRARVTVTLNLGQALLAQERLLEAAEAAREAEAAALVAGVVVELPEVYRLLGQVATRRGQEDAFVFFERALEVVESWGLPARQRAETLEAYAELAERQGDPALAAQRRDEARALFAEGEDGDQNHDDGREAPGGETTRDEAHA